VRGGEFVTLDCDGCFFVFFVDDCEFLKGFWNKVARLECMQ